MAVVIEHSDALSACRICLEDRTEMYSVFSELENGSIIASIITESTDVQIQEDDGLSECICSDCVEEVKFVASFVEKTRQADRVLRELCKPEVKQEDEEPQLYSLEISLLDHPKEVETKVEIEDNEITDHEEVADTSLMQDFKIKEDHDLAVDADETESHQDFDDGNDNDSDYVGENASDSDEDYMPGKGASKQTELSFVDANCTFSDSDGEPKQKRKKRSPNKVKLDKSIPVELDDVEKETFTIIDVGDHFVCCTCFKLFNSEAELITHGKTVHQPKRNLNPAKRHVCKLCFRRYSSKMALQDHCKKAASITQVFDCKLCDAKFVSPPMRYQHAHKHPPVVPKSAIIVAPIPLHALQNGTLCCAQGCNQVFDSEEELLAHSTKEHLANKIEADLNQNEKRTVQCLVCYRKFMDERGLKQHQQRLYLPKRHVCSICGIKFAFAAECKRHETEHVPVEKKFKCEQCPKKYAFADQLKAHVKRHSATREFMCNICGQSYLQRHNLQAHMWKHEGKKPFECDTCGKGFRVKAKMIYHKRTHSGERPFACRYCEQAFADSTNRLRHEMSHTGIKPYKCDYCDKTFITKRLKREHEKTHFNSRRNQHTCKTLYEEAIEID
ncbi:zinc finger protein 774-like [Armigeres subalbatus]|uniref:zinc finger protein 774-like n=1 Tax=Armigeres subalbatus TaxID=124917 RepID=UPI002ED42D67